jgi:excisionase family DNA binding protein
MTVPEVAEYLRIDPQTVYRMLRVGELRGIKAGREWRVHRTTLERFVRGEAPSCVDLLTVEQAARYMTDPALADETVTPEDVVHYITEAGLPATYFRGQWLLARDDLDRYVTPNEQRQIEKARQEHQSGASIRWGEAKKTLRSEQ